MVTFPQRLHLWIKTSTTSPTRPRAAGYGGVRTVFAVLLVMCAYAPCDANAQGYGGPSLLSRGGNRPGHRGRAPVNFNVYASVRGLYETGLIIPRLNAAGQLEPAAAYGVQTEVGMYGGKDWKRNSIGMDYRADYRHQPSYRGANGTNQAVSLSTQHRLSRRTMLMLQETGGTSNRAFGGFAAPAFGGPDALGIPINELFDVRLYFLQTAVSASWQKSARTAAFAAVDGFFVKRRSFSLINGQGGRVQSGVSYRMSRATTVTVTGSFMRFEFPRVYALSDIYNASAGIERRISRNLDFKMKGGFYQIKSQGVQQVQLSPEVAAILGRKTGQAAFTRTQTAPMVDANLGYLQEHGRAYIGFTRGVNPGNGVFLTTGQTSINGGYSYTGIRRVSLGVSAGYIRSRSFGLSLQDIGAWQGGGGITYKIAEHLSLMSQFDRRHFSLPNTQGRSGTSISVGLVYSPSRFPLSIF